MITALLCTYGRKEGRERRRREEGKKEEREEKEGKKNGRGYGHVRVPGRAVWGDITQVGECEVCQDGRDISPKVS